MADSTTPDLRMIQVNPLGKQSIHYYLCMLDLPFAPDPQQFVLLDTPDDLNNINYFYHGTFDSPAGTATTVAMPVFTKQHTYPEPTQPYNITGVTVKDQNGTVKKGDMNKGVLVNDDLTPDVTQELNFIRPFVIQSYTNPANYFVCAMVRVPGEGVNSPTGVLSPQPPVNGVTDLSFILEGVGGNSGSQPPPLFIASVACIPSTLNQYGNIQPMTGSTNPPTPLSSFYANPISDYNPLAGSSVSS